MNNFVAVFCIVNTGFSEVAMEAAKRLGARGGFKCWGSCFHALSTQGRSPDLSELQFARL